MPPLSAEATLEPTTEQPKARRKKGSLPWWVTLLVLAIVAAGFAGLIHFAYLPKNGLTAEDFNADAREKLQIGASTRDDVKAWYASKGITEVQDSLDAGGKKNGYMTQIPNDSWLKKSELDIRFLFDGSGKLREIMIFQGKRD